MDVASGDHTICRMRPGGIGAGGHTGAMQGKEHTEIPLTAHGKRAFTQDEEADSLCVNGLLRTVSALPVAGQSGKAGEEGKETPTKGRIKTGARRSHLSGRPRTQIKVLGGMGVQGEGRPFFKRGPFPLPKEFPNAVPADA